jgi:ABC-2 type transport system ATP-binding protein
VNSSADIRRPAAIAVTGLRKSFGDQVVLDGIDLTVPEGTIFALLGPDGAGKTTVVQILSTLLPADAGDIRVAGHDLAAEPDAVRAAIGVTGQFSAVDNLLTGEENLRLMTDLHHLGRAAGRQRAAALLRQFGLADAAAKAAATYSGGMRRRLDLAMTLTGNPKLIFLNEPTTGLDPRSRRTGCDRLACLSSGRAECGDVDCGRVAGRPAGQRVDRVDVDEAVAFPEGPGGFVGAVAG